MAERDRPPPETRPESSDAAALEPPSFETTLDRLEHIVERLEVGDLALEQALAGFEEGVQLSRRLAEQLGEAERKVERLSREGGLLVTRPLRADEESD